MRFCQSASFIAIPCPINPSVQSGAFQSCEGLLPSHLRILIRSAFFTININIPIFNLDLLRRGFDIGLCFSFFLFLLHILSYLFFFDLLLLIFNIFSLDFDLLGSTAFLLGASRGQSGFLVRGRCGGGAVVVGG